MKISDLVTNGSLEGRMTLAREEIGVSPGPEPLGGVPIAIGGPSGVGDRTGAAVSNSDIRQIKLNYL